MRRENKESKWTNIWIIAPMRFINIVRKTTKSRISPVEVLMQQPVTDKEFKNFTDCAVKKSNENSLIFTTEDMEKPFISFNEGMWNFFEPELQKRLYEMEKDDIRGLPITIEQRFYPDAQPGCRSLQSSLISHLISYPM